MKKVVLVFTGLLWMSVFYGQNNPVIVLTCDDVSENCAKLFVQYYKAGNLDSVAIIMDYWEGKCGNTEQVQRARILFAIDQKQFRNAVLKPGILDKVLEYKDKENADEPKKNPDEFDIFTKQLAASLMEHSSKSARAYAWCEFYGDDANRLLKRVQNRELDESLLAQEYFEEAKKIKISASFNMAAVLGGWLPLGKLTNLGSHPEIGYCVGARIARFNFDIIAGYRFSNTSTSEIQYKGSTVKTDCFSSYFVGLDIGVGIFKKRQNEILLAGGFGYENFNVVRKKEIPAMESSYMNLGVAYRRYFQHNTYIGIQLKYNNMRYLSGSLIKDARDVLLARVCFGWLSEGKKAAQKNRLQFDDDNY
jgi:hypothetical protein